MVVLLDLHEVTELSVFRSSMWLCYYFLKSCECRPLVILRSETAPIYLKAKTKAEEYINKAEW